MPTEQEIRELAFTGKLIEALRPLASAAFEFDDEQANGGFFEDNSYVIFQRHGRTVTVGDCRRAKELIEEWERNY